MGGGKWFHARLKPSASAIELKISPELLEGVYLNIKKSVVELGFIFEIGGVFVGRARSKLSILAPKISHQQLSLKSAGESRNGVLRGLHGLYPHGKINFNEKYFFIMEKNYFEKNNIFSENQKNPKIQTKIQNFPENFHIFKRKIPRFLGFFCWIFWIFWIF